MGALKSTRFTDTLLRNQVVKFSPRDGEKNHKKGFRGRQLYQVRLTKFNLYLPPETEAEPILNPLKHTW